MTNEVRSVLVDLIQAAVDLANSIQHDIQNDSYISDGTIQALNDFRVAHENVDATLGSDSDVH